jgi:hypothetical protein
VKLAVKKMALEAHRSALAMVEQHAAVLWMVVEKMTATGRFPVELGDMSRFSVCTRVRWSYERERANNGGMMITNFDGRVRLSATSR